MDSQEALEIIDGILQPQSLSDVQELVFCGVWSGKTYVQIAASSSYDTEYMRHVGSNLWQLLSEKLAEKVTKSNCHSILRRIAVKTINKKLHSTTDWLEAPDIADFYGRKAELTTLKRWLGSEGCRAIAILGMGGIGKTTLAIELARQVEGFAFIIWRSLCNAPPLEDIVTDLVHFISRQQVNKPSFSQLIQYLHQSRCLIILDNWESVLESGLTGVYRAGYEGYGELIKAIAQAAHGSCLIVTSREKPPEIATFEGNEARSLALKGSPEAALALVESKGLVGSIAEKKQLGDRYGNIPLAIKIVATSVQDLFDGAVAEFLAQDTTVFNGVRRLLEQQFERLSAVEQCIMYWLAINREWTTLEELFADIVPFASKVRVLEALEALIWRSLIERQAGRYTQQPAIMKYVSDRLIEQVSEELISLEFSLFTTHALLKTTVKDYIRESQERLILQPIADRFRRNFNFGAEEQIKRAIAVLRCDRANASGYGGSNLINLAIELQIELNGYDFSDLNLSHAYLQNTYLHQVNLSRCNLAQAVFAQSFGIIFSLAFAPIKTAEFFPQAKGNLVATGDGSGKVIVWQISDGQSLLTLEGHSNLVLSVAWSLDGQFLASSSADRTIRIWNMKTGSCDRILSEHQNWVWSVAWSLDRKMLASGSGDRAVKLWDVERGECLKTIPHEGAVVSIAWNRDGQLLATGGAERVVRLWNLDGSCLKVLKGHSDEIWCVAWHPDGNILASSSDEGTIKLWDSVTGNCLQTLTGHANTVCTIAWHPDGNILASSSRDRTVRLWQLANGECLHVLSNHSSWVWAVAWSPDRQYLASGSHDCTVRLWQPQTGVCLRTVQGYQGAVRTVAWSPQGSRILASGSYDGIVRLWDVETGNYWQTLAQEYPSWSARIWSVSWSPDGKMLATASDDGKVRLWEMATGGCWKTLEGHANALWSLAWSLDGRTIASGSHDQTIRLWEASSGQCLNVLQGHRNWVLCVAWNCDNRTLASGGEDRTVRLWDAASGRCLQVLAAHNDWVWAVAWHPEGKFLATASADRSVKIWEPKTGACLKVIEGHTEPVRAIAWSPDGRTIASGSDDRTIRYWDVISGQCHLVMSGHASPVVSLAWSPDGQTIASGSTDETIKLWDVNSGKYKQTLRADRPYEGSNINGVRGLTVAQQATLRTLGAIEE